jgi:uncharacterized protein (UPF0332 family)
MTEEEARARIVRYWCERSHTSHKAAHREAAAGDYILAINRAYYALFYAVSALLLEEGRQFKRHSGVRAAFNRDFIRTGRVEMRYGDLYNQLFDDRQAGDYVALTEFDAEYVQERIEACETFLKHLRPLLRSLPPETEET